MIISPKFIHSIARREAAVLWVAYDAQAAPAKSGYQVMLEKSVRDKTVADFMARNRCT
ncbi:MAG TPA: hypothetical protein VK897_16410 [Anaerolineales bacterium]|nr:hypothetical protein [Anaerolineales bacterium]